MPGFLSKIFAWWRGSNFGARLDAASGRFVGEDQFGNRYYTRANGKRRFVIYNGMSEASLIPPEWHLWLHGRDMPPPSEKPLPRPRWAKPWVPNLTGTPYAHMPSGALPKAGVRARATGDYEAWAPDA
ncbi:MAG: NADH:ubiquinone oxidoreductase subunit NDUFA12 [Sphingomonadaceae bacterium]|nr:NADH:ubiquinone oxidoreductase subunit NDUFA12 [Sphingomonadaceae bacterium]